MRENRIREKVFDNLESIAPVEGDRFFGIVARNADRLVMPSRDVWKLLHPVTQDSCSRE